LPRPSSIAIELRQEKPMKFELELAEDPSDKLRKAILEPLTVFNSANGYPPDAKPLAVVARDDSGEIIGGLWGKTGYGWLFVEFLTVDASFRNRGLGVQLMIAAEDECVRRGCVGAWLTTFSFQARGFYEKLGYSVFGELEESPGENIRIFMRKRLTG
jgi:GNAT superfamily N-acetyltransferase